VAVICAYGGMLGSGIATAEDHIKSILTCSRFPMTQAFKVSH